MEFSSRKKRIFEIPVFIPDRSTFLTRSREQRRERAKNLCARGSRPSCIDPSLPSPRYRAARGCLRMTLRNGTVRVLAAD